MSKDFPHVIDCTDGFKRKVDRIAALLKLDSWHQALGYAVHLALQDAEAHVKGDTEAVFCTPRVAELMANNHEFIAALCEEGVVEWLTPFVLAKSKQGNQPTTTPTTP
jgi:hypothetical protein